MADDSAMQMDSNEQDWEQLSGELIRRCKEVELECRMEEEEGIGRWVVVNFKNGRDVRPIHVDESSVEKFLSFKFEIFSFLGDYRAVVRNLVDGTREIEAELRSLSQSGSGAFFTALADTEDRTTLERFKTLELPQSGHESALRLEVGPPTVAFTRLVWGPSKKPRFTLRLFGNVGDRHDEQVNLLERISMSLFFQIEGLFGTPLALASWPPPLTFAKREKAELKDLKFPVLEYERTPMALYFYAAGASGLPLVRYLALYQVVEYYMPTFYRVEAQRRVRLILKDPTFRADRDTDIARILDSLDGAPGTAYADERSMLRATLNECVDPRSLWAFLSETSNRRDFFKKKHPSLTDFQLQIGPEESDLRQAAADRIYDIRCRIVHTKAGGRKTECQLLLPGSKEAAMLKEDLALVHFVARQVLIFASAPFHR